MIILVMSVISLALGFGIGFKHGYRFGVEKYIKAVKELQKN